MELICRVRNALRKSGKAPSVFQVQDLHIDATKGIVMKAGSEIVLSALEYRLLLVFLNHFGETLSRRELLHEIWDVTGAGGITAGDFIAKRLPLVPAILLFVAVIGFVALAYYLGGKKICNMNLVDAIKDDTLML